MQLNPNPHTLRMRNHSLHHIRVPRVIPKQLRKRHPRPHRRIDHQRHILKHNRCLARQSRLRLAILLPIKAQHSPIKRDIRPKHRRENRRQNTQQRIHQRLHKRQARRDIFRRPAHQKRIRLLHITRHLRLIPQNPHFRNRPDVPELLLDALREVHDLAVSREQLHSALAHQQPPLDVNAVRDIPELAEVRLDQRHPVEHLIKRLDCLRNGLCLVARELLEVTRHRRSLTASRELLNSRQQIIERDSLALRH